jgi:hypothetical protein
MAAFGDETIDHTVPFQRSIMALVGALLLL